LPGATFVSAASADAAFLSAEAGAAGAAGFLRFIVACGTAFPAEGRLIFAVSFFGAETLSGATGAEGFDA
jgi:hypothetical protein